MKSWTMLWYTPSPPLLLLIHTLNHTLTKALDRCKCCPADIITEQTCWLSFSSISTQIQAQNIQGSLEQFVQCVTLFWSSRYWSCCNVVGLPHALQQWVSNIQLMNRTYQCFLGSICLTVLLLATESVQLLHCKNRPCRYQESSKK